MINQRLILLDDADSLMLIFFLLHGVILSNSANVFATNNFYCNLLDVYKVNPNYNFLKNY